MPLLLFAQVLAFLDRVVTARSALSLGLVAGSPALSNKRLRRKARTLRLQEIR